MNHRSDGSNEGIEDESRRILVIDDALDFSNSLCRLLRDTGACVTPALTLCDALRRIADWPRTPFDCVLLDVRLPDGLGTTLLAPLTSVEPPPAVIVCTAYFDEIIALASHAFGAIPFPKVAGDATVLRRLLLGVGVARHAIHSGQGVKLEHVVTQVANQAHLTPSEANTLRLLVLGGNADDVARHFAVGSSYARAEVRALLAKCGAESAHDLALAIYRAAETGDESGTSRSSPVPSSHVTPEHGFSAASLGLDSDRGAVDGPNGSVTLTEAEIDLLEYVAKYPQGAPPRQIAADLFARQDNLGRGRDLVYTHFSNLRRKLRKAGLNPDLIEKTRRGYRIRRQ